MLGMEVHSLSLRSSPQEALERKMEPNPAQAMVLLLREALWVLCEQLREAQRHNEMLEKRCAHYDSHIKNTLLERTTTRKGAEQADPALAWQPAVDREPSGHGALCAFSLGASQPPLQARAPPSAPLFAVAVSGQSTDTATACSSAIEPNPAPEATAPLCASQFALAGGGRSTDTASAVPAAKEPTPLPEAELQAEGTSQIEPTVQRVALRSRLRSSRSSRSSKRTVSFRPTVATIEALHELSDDEESLISEPMSEMYEPLSPEEVQVLQRQFSIVRRQMASRARASTDAGPDDPWLGGSPETDAVVTEPVAKLSMISSEKVSVQDDLFNLNMKGWSRSRLPTSSSICSKSSSGSPSRRPTLSRQRLAPGLAEGNAPPRRLTLFASAPCTPAVWLPTKAPSTLPSDSRCLLSSDK